MRSASVLLLSGLLVLAACGGGDDDASGDGAAAIDPADVPDLQTTAPPNEETGPPGGGQGTATLTLDNGETFEFSVLCALEPQTAAGSEILFTVVSRDVPSLDITQFGDEGQVTGIASVSVYDAQFETIWEAATFYEPFGGGVELTLDGSTIRGVGSFIPDGDVQATPVPGEIIAEC